jgi:hypothetical protein
MSLVSMCPTSATYSSWVGVPYTRPLGSLTFAGTCVMMSLHAPSGVLLIDSSSLRPITITTLMFRVQDVAFLQSTSQTTLQRISRGLAGTPPPPARVRLFPPIFADNVLQSCS